jgi:hypothetical protein
MVLNLDRGDSYPGRGKSFLFSATSRPAVRLSSNLFWKDLNFQPTVESNQVGIRNAVTIQSSVTLDVTRCRSEADNYCVHLQGRRLSDT